ncbi:hypothetical protein TNCV_4631951 [Trichonephila clavipes]|nr:hypothetical protein TNCV_4631951 [Trichonephila clavipes]
MATISMKSWPLTRGRRYFYQIISYCLDAAKDQSGREDEARNICRVSQMACYRSLQRQMPIEALSLSLYCESLLRGLSPMALSNFKVRN